MKRGLHHLNHRLLETWRLKVFVEFRKKREKVHFEVLPSVFRARMHNNRMFSSQAMQVVYDRYRT